MEIVRRRSLGGDPERGRKPRALIERGLTTRALLLAALLDKPFAGIWRREEKLTGFGRIKKSEVGEDEGGDVAIEGEPGEVGRREMLREGLYRGGILQI